MTNDIVKHQLECFEKQKDERHKLRDDMQKSITILDDKIDKNKDISNKQVNELRIINGKYNENLKSMSDNIKKVEDKVDKLSDKLDNFITTFTKNADEKYVTKESYKWLIKVLWVFWVAIIMWMWWFIWDLITNNLIWKN